MSTLRARIASDAGKLSQESLLGKRATYTATGSTIARSVNVVFCPPFSQVDMFDADATNTAPLLFVAESEVATPARGDTYVIDDVTWYSQKIIPNGIGMNVVTISKQATHG